MRRLIINADDLGINPQRSHGIFMAAEQGIVTNVSVIPNMNDSDAAVRRSRERDIPAGLHINLTEGAPLSRDSDIDTLLTTDGFFLGRETLRRRMAEDEVKPEHIEREIRAQIEWFLDARGQPTHIDSHHHLHVHPQVIRMLIPILDRYAISFVRVPSEPDVPFGFEIEPARSRFIAEISREAETARSLLQANRIGCTEHFRGMAFTGAASMRNMRHILGRLPEGVTEWMVHPGSPNPNAEPFDADPQRQTELNILLSDDTREELKSREIELCSYGDLF